MTLRGERVVLREATADDEPALRAILLEPEVARWWTTADEILYPETTTWVIEVDGVTAGLIQAWEENEPEYRHAGIDLALATAFQGQGLGPDAVRTVALHLVRDRGHHRLTIDPAADNERAIRAYERVGFRAVGVLRRYERLPDGTHRDGLLMDLLAEELLGD